MSDSPGARRPRPAEPHHRMRLAALSAVIIGVILVASAAFALSYPGIHHIALETGVAPGLARLYPLMLDAAVIVACAAALALRGARWWRRGQVWLLLLLLLCLVAAGDATDAMGIVLPRQPSRAAVAVLPWALLLLTFALWLMMLRHARRAREARAPAGGGAQHAGAGDRASARNVYVIAGEAGEGRATDRRGADAGDADTAPGASAADTRTRSGDTAADAGAGTSLEADAGDGIPGHGEEAGGEETGTPLHGTQAPDAVQGPDAPDSGSPATARVLAVPFDRVRATPTPPQT